MLHVLITAAQGRDRLAKLDRFTEGKVKLALDIQLSGQQQDPLQAVVGNCSVRDAVNFRLCLTSLQELQKVGEDPTPG